MVGELYEKGDRRRDSGLTIFYMGINCGSIGGQLVCTFFADLFGWWAGFLVVGLGMLIPWTLIQFDGGRLAGHGEETGRPHVGTPGPNAHLFCRPLLEKHIL